VWSSCLVSVWSLKQIVHHDCWVLEFVYSLPIITPPSSFQLSRFVTYTYFPLFEIFLFRNFLCCNQTWWCSFFTPLGSRVSTRPSNKCVWLKSSILLHMCFPNRSKAPLNDHFVLVKGFLSVTSNTRVGTLIVATIYLQLIQNRYMFRSFTVLQCSHQHCVQPVASDMEVVGYL